MHAIKTAGLVASDPAMWSCRLPGPVRLKHLQTENQIFDVIRERSVDVLALELAWFEDLHWLPAILEQASLSGLSVVFLLENPVRVIKATTVQGVPPGMAYAPNRCVNFDFRGHQALHYARPLGLPWRSVQLLAILSDNEGRSVDSLWASTLASEVQWGPWTESLMKVHVFQIRKILGSAHIVTVPKSGYRFIPCESGVVG